MSETPKPAQKFFTPIEKALIEDNERITARQQQLDAAQHDESTQGSDKALGSQHQHSYDPSTLAPKKNFDQKVYLFPPSYNALRAELHEHWPTLFYETVPHLGRPLAWLMVHDAANFIGVMNGALDMHQQLDTDNVSAICEAFLDGLRVKRGLSKLH